VANNETVNLTVSSFLNFLSIAMNKVGYDACPKEENTVGAHANDNDDDEANRKNQTAKGFRR